MQRDEGILSGLFTRFRNQGKKPARTEIGRFTRFLDPLGNFEIKIPINWKFDRDVIVDAGQYSISFESPDGRMRFVVSVDTRPPKQVDFKEYVKKECEGPSSGIICNMEREDFRGYPGFGRKFHFVSSREESIREDAIFLTKNAVFTLSRTYPASKGQDEEIELNAALFKTMLSSFTITKGISVRSVEVSDNDMEYR